MNARPVQIAILSVVALGIAALLVWSASTGPGRIVGEMHATETTVVPRPQPLPSAPTASATPTPQRQVRHPPPARADKRSSWLGDLLAIVLFGAGLWLVTAVGRALFQRFASDVSEQRDVLDLEPLPDPEAAREALQRDRERHFAALDESDLRNGIVGCWVLLEEAAAQAGLPRRPSETPTEFVVRFLHGLDVDPRPVARLAELFHEARFSTHQLPPDARTRAEAALAAIHADLAVVGVNA